MSSPERPNPSPPPSRLLQFDFTATVTHGLTKDTDHFRCKCTCFRDGERWDMQTIRWDNGKPTLGWRTIIDGYAVSYQMPPPGQTAVMGFYCADGSRFIGAAIPSGIGAFDGYVAGDRVSISQVLRTAAHVETSRDTIGGVDCVLVKADSPEHGQYQIWFDPRAGNLPRKVIVEKTSTNDWGGTRLDQWPHQVPHGSRGPAPHISASFTMDQAKLENVGGHWFPLSCRVTRVHRFADGNWETTVMQCRRTRLELNPDFQAAKAFVPELREGARLANQIDQQLPFQWKHGAPAPLMDSTVLANMDQTAQKLKEELHAGKP